MNLRTCMVAAFSVALASPAMAQLTGIDSTPPVLMPGDLARITVWHRAELSGDFLVANDSSISHPLMRDLKLGGIPLPVAEERLRVFLTRFDATPAFTFTPLQRIFVGGEVRLPNVYTVPPGTTIAQSIALAGGPTDRGALDKVLLNRRQQRQALDLTLVGSTAAEAGVRSGDQILVTRRSSLFADVLAPAGSVLAALAAVTSVIIQVRR